MNPSSQLQGPSRASFSTALPSDSRFTHTHSKKAKEQEGSAPTVLHNCSQQCSEIKQVKVGHKSRQAPELICCKVVPEIPCPLET